MGKNFPLNKQEVKDAAAHPKIIFDRNRQCCGALGNPLTDCMDLARSYVIFSVRLIQRKSQEHDVLSVMSLLFTSPDLRFETRISILQAQMAVREVMDKATSFSYYAIHNKRYLVRYNVQASIVRA
jgi:hypothetical protein